MNNNYESHAISRRSFLKASGVVGAAGILAACGGNSGSSSTAASSGATSAPNTTGATPLKEFISWESTNRELESWNMLYSQMASDMNVTTNLWEGLLSFDCYGKAVPSVAKEWSHNEDSSVWTFNLRDDVDWVDVNGEVKAHLTSKDFLVGLEWVLNAAKNQANNTSMPNETLTGAADYYQKTSDMGDAAAELTYQDMLDAGVGVEAPDDYTLVFTCKDPCPYFDTVAAYTSFYPVSEDLINELGIEGFRACDYTNMWYNGPYVVEEFISQNTKSYIPNPNYYAADEVSRFDRFTVTMISDGTVTFQLYQNRELDEMDVGESTLTTIQADPKHRLPSVLLQGSGADQLVCTYQQDQPPEVRERLLHHAGCLLQYQGSGVHHSGGQGDGLRQRGLRRQDHDPSARQQWRHRGPEEAGYGRAERHRRHLPRPRCLLHHRRQLHRSGQRNRAEAVLHRQLRR